MSGPVATGTDATPGRDGTAPPVLTAVLEAARGNPGAVCVRELGHLLTYGELLRYVEHTGRELVAAGVGPGDLVAVRCTRRGPAVAAMLAAWQVGAGYLPLSPAEHPDRLRRMLAAARPAAVLGDAADPARPAVCTPGGPDRVAVPPQTSYVLFTSGSTGAPKGVVVGHAGLGDLVGWYAGLTRLGPGEPVGQVADLGFDASIMEIWGSLAAGASLVVPSRDEVLDPARLCRFICDHRLAVCFVPTGLVAPLLDQPWPAASSLRVLITGGDRLALPASPVSHPFVLVNAYGPAECTVVATSEVIDLRQPRQVAVLPPLGRPLAHVRTRVTAADGRRCRPGESGELWLSGSALLLGYLAETGTPLVTVPGDVSSGSAGGPRRWYRTGDLVVSDRDGVLRFVSRIDDQLQIGGRRTEPAEIAAAAHDHPEVTAAVVFAVRTPAGRQRLAVAVTPAAVPASGLQDFLADRLPAHMVPSEVLALDAMPLTGRGKVDTHRLRATLAARKGPGWT
jgi:amino acid adenylation domain-containing protein